MHIDLNCDMGESFGAYTIGADEMLMPLITSANIACGFHAGDPRVMQRTVQLALAHRVALGAHPGFADLAGFGRRAIDATPAEIETDVLYQIGALDAFARAAGARLVHVKAHGALYNLAAAKIDVARALANAVKRFDDQLIFVGLAGSVMLDAARELGLRVAREGFCDRVYTPDGKLMSRREPGSLIDDPQRAAAQALQMVVEQTVTASNGEKIPMSVDTLCIHGDHPVAPAIARAVREMLERHGVSIHAL